MRLLTFAGLASLMLVPQIDAKDREWQTGRVLDARTRATAEVTTSTTRASASGQGVSGPLYAGNASGSSETTTTRTIETSSEIFIVGQQFVYVMQNSERPSVAAVALGGLFGARAPAHRGRHQCRYIIGADIQYAQEKGVLHIIDADGKQCETDIIRQEVRNPAPLGAAHQ